MLKLIARLMPLEIRTQFYLQWAPAVLASNQSIQNAISSNCVVS